MRALVIGCVLVLGMGVASAAPGPPPAEASAKAQKHMEARQWTEAIMLLELTTDEHPSYAMGWYQLAFAYRKDGRYRDSVTAYEKYIALEPGKADPYFGLGLSLRGTGDRVAARAAFQKYIELEKDPTKLRYVERAKVEIMELDGQTPPAGAAPDPDVVPAPAAAPGAPAPPVARVGGEADRATGDAAFRARRYEEAATHYRGVLERHPEDTVASYRLGVALAAAGKLEEAILAWAQTLMFDPTHDDARRNIELARKRLESIGARAPELTRDAAIQDATRLLDEGRYAAALGVLDAYLASHGDDVGVRALRARALLGAGDGPGAVAELSAVLAIDPAWIRAYQGLGDAHAAAGDTPRARYYYALYLERARGLPGEVGEIRAVERRVEQLPE